MSNQPKIPDAAISVSNNKSPSVSGCAETVSEGVSIPFAIHSAILDALEHAENKHPRFADTDSQAVNVILEELLEVNTAALRVAQNINDQASRDNLFVELAQLNATTIRMMGRLLEK